jgi:translation initiation factor 2 beta subunit (eIF-2beta)/eIF-5
MNKINIIGAKQKNKEIIYDSFYRYKMDKLIVNKIKNKLIIDNLDIIAKELHINPNAIAVFYKNYLNTNIKYNNGQLEINGNTFTQKYLQDSLDEFIDEFIICSNCNLPELEHYCNKNELCIKCKSCGLNEKNNSKYTTVAKTILKNLALNKTK